MGQKKKHFDAQKSGRFNTTWKSEMIETVATCSLSNLTSECDDLFFDLFFERCLYKFFFCSPELTVRSKDNTVEKLENSSREDTICFQMPDNGLLYIALTSHEFSDYIRD